MTSPALSGTSTSQRRLSNWTAFIFWPNLKKELEGSPQPTYFYMASNLVAENSNGPFGSAKKSLSTWESVTSIMCYRLET